MRDWVAVILAVGVVVGVDMLALALVWGAVFGSHPGEDVARALFGMMGALIGILGTLVGIRASSRGRFDD